jgi:hypothetical protein
MTLEDQGSFTGNHLTVHGRLLGGVIQRQISDFFSPAEDAKQVTLEMKTSHADDPPSASFDPSVVPSSLIYSITVMTSSCRSSNSLNQPVRLEQLSETLRELEVHVLFIEEIWFPSIHAKVFSTVPFPFSQ